MVYNIILYLEEDDRLSSSNVGIYKTSVFNLKFGLVPTLSEYKVYLWKMNADLGRFEADTTKPY